jgi:hypothetical protein
LAANRSFRIVAASAALAAVAAIWGCAASLPIVRLDAAPREVELLAGEWVGKYAVDGDGERSGNIMFFLVAGEDHAHGDVLMTSPRLQQSQLGLQDEAFGGTRYVFIDFMRIEEGFVSGAMDPYWDPDRNCWAATIFQGRVTDDTIAGRFRTRFSLSLPEVEGAWKVTRQKGPSR